MMYKSILSKVLVYTNFIRILKGHMKKIHLSFFIIPLLSIGVLCILYFLSQIQFIERIGNIVNDTFTYRLQYTQNKHSDDIVIIKIDDITLDSLWKSDLWMIAFDKWTYAELIEKIFTQYQASVLGIDIVFANPSVLWEVDEQKLARTLEKYKDKIVIASRSDYNPHPLCLYSNVQHGIIDTFEQDKLRVFPIKAFEYDLKTRCPGSLISENNQWNIFPFTREVLDIYKENTDPFRREIIEKNLAKFDTKGTDRAYIDYYSNGKNNSGTFGFESYSFIDIFRGLRETSDGQSIDLKWKIVLLGEVGTLIHDSHFTPVHQNLKMPWVEINANIITTLQLWRDIREFSFTALFLLFFLLQILLIASVFSMRISFTFLVLFIINLVLIVFWGWMFVGWYIVDIFLGILGSIMSLLLAYIYRFKVTDKAKRIIKQQFSSYVSPDVVEEISQNPDSVLIQWEKRNMTIFFSDIVSFTSISENSSPEVIVEILNEYFSEMTKIIYENKGTLDKYIGDAVMCFFNAPLRQDNHSFYACRTALAQQKKLKELNIQWQKMQYPEIKIRIGIHTGEAIHGNIWSSDTRVNYTIIGDSVNLASRLEWVCKQYGISICVSQDVYELQKDTFHFREIDVIEVKGRQKPVRIYQLLWEKNVPLTPKHQEYLERYKQALDAYKQEDFSKAQELFSLNIGDETSHIMSKRCKDIQEWVSKINQGVFQLHTK